MKQLRTQHRVSHTMGLCCQLFTPEGVDSALKMLPLKTYVDGPTLLLYEQGFSFYSHRTAEDWTHFKCPGSSTQAHKIFRLPAESLCNMLTNPAMLLSFQSRGHEWGNLYIKKLSDPLFSSTPVSKLCLFRCGQDFGSPTGVQCNIRMGSEAR